MNTTFMNSKNSEIFNLHRLLLNIIDKINSKKSDKYVALSNLGIYSHGKILKRHTKNDKFKYQLRHGMKNLNYLIDHIWHEIFQITLNIS